MKYALVNGTRQESSKGLSGNCPACGSDLVARCGQIRIHHWAHKNQMECDHWWEPETDWHRAWKGHFPMEWQEVVMHDSVSGEKHIADVKTGNGLVIEFQHSPIDPVERVSRERFYKNMVWVVDAGRSKRDVNRFLKNKDVLKPFLVEGLFISGFPDEVFPAKWLDSDVPVVFDFSSASGFDVTDSDLKNLWCLFRLHREPSVLLARIDKKVFVNFTNNGQWDQWVHQVVEFRRLHLLTQQTPPINIAQRLYRPGYESDPRTGHLVKRRRH